VAKEILEEKLAPTFTIKFNSPVWERAVAHRIEESTSAIGKVDPNCKTMVGSDWQNSIFYSSSVERIIHLNNVDLLTANLVGEIVMLSIR
tara:strand:+ start:365 stop:634 length:270 start_codon:yes stop_codon:yes gene_type:complete